MKSGNTVTRFSVNMISSLLTTLIRITVLVWVNQYLLHRIEPEEYALVPIVASLMVVAELFPLIFQRGVVRFMVAADARSDAERLTNVVSSMLPVLLGMAAVVLVGGLWAVARLDTLIKVEPAYLADARLMLLLLILVLAFEFATTPFRVGLNVRMRFVEQNLILLGTESIRVALLMVLIFGIGPRALWVTVATTSATVLNILILIGYTFWVLPEARFRLGAMSRATVWQLMSFSLWTLVQAFNNLILRAAPALFLNRFGTAVDVASYQVGNLADVQLRKLLTTAMAPAMPALTNVYARQGENPMQKLYYLGGRYYLWVTHLLLPPLMIFAYPLMDLYAGARYRDAATVMILLLAAYPFTWAASMYFHIAYAVGKVRVFNLCTLATGVSQLAGILYFVVVRDQGAVGAALGMSGGFIVAQVLVMWPFGLRLVNGSWSRFVRQTLIPGLVPCGVALGACVLYGELFPIRGWAGLGAGSLFSVLVYLGVLFGFCLAPEDRDLIGRAWRRISGRFRRNRAP